MCAGTIITECDDGAAIWSTVLASKDTLHQLVTNLVAICKFHGFDGWLINVENKIEVTRFVLCLILANNRHAMV